MDFAAVTDHSEHFGEMGVCNSADMNGRYSFECQLLRGFWWQPGLFPGSAQRSMATSAFNLLTLPNDGPSTFNTHLPMCVDGEANCFEGERRVWDEIQAAAEAYYDRSSECSFTTFIAYEMTSTPLGENWHRNVIFRNDKVVSRPITAIDLARKPNPDPNTTAPRQIVKGGPDIEKLWDGLRDQCLKAGTGCDVITIPHNYDQGVPMGGDLPKQRKLAPGQAPSFIAAAWMDDYIGTPLQQVQIIKGWVENGQTLEKVYTVAGNADNGASVDQPFQSVKIALLNQWVEKAVFLCRSVGRHQRRHGPQQNQGLT
ncbi:Protein of unknown function [Methylomagnum ishizawai]|uniref:Uncharacterized protein n=1 Tax=Methylomagnum ishizawai TaxID=1760988 RepID=A0A1Y6D4E5_9GAMM|nr:Protein of unknown function [Methylomagnum ishizawai]